MPNISPASPEAERHLIGVLIRDGLKLPDGLVPSDFSEPLLADVAVAIRTLEDKGETADEFTVINFLRNTKFDRPDAFISALTTDAGHAVFNPSHVSLVRRQSALRRLKDTAARALKLADDAEADPQLIVDFAEGEFKAVHGRTAKDAGAELMDLAALESFERKADPNNLIGNRWLTKSASLLLVSQSGVGKSSFALQMMVSLATGRPFFGIAAKRPLRVVMLQAENDLGDVAESFQDIVGGMNLYPDERRQLTENLFIYRDTRSVGPDFLARMRELVVKHSADVFLCDPLLSFCGIEVADQSQMTNFLRHGINPILYETGVVGMFVHHTTKPRSAKDKEGQTPADLAYAGAGASELTNWVRECACLQRCPGDDPVFKFALTKRRGRSGMKDEAGDFKSEITVRHSKTPGVIRWEYAPNVVQTAPTKADSSPAKGSPRRFDAR